LETFRTRDRQPPGSVGYSKMFCSSGARRRVAARTSVASVDQHERRRQT
jgi:hypothetical protein